MTTYNPARPPMTAAGLAGHKVTGYGRNYAESDDGYSDMAAEEKRGWRALASWGRDGWNLGDWPYVVVYVRESPAHTPDCSQSAGDCRCLPSYELMQICEGDRTVYSFTTVRDRNAAIDYMFLWYAADKHWAPLTWEDRERLDAGELEVDLKFRGPYRHES
jgi:hypothetical protein